MSKSSTIMGAKSAVLLLFFGLAVHSMVQKSPTFDEQGFLVRGLAYLRGDSQSIRVGHPLGLNALNALFLVNDDSVGLPIDHPSWKETSFHRPAELFLWEIGNDVEHIMFLARLPTVFLGMLLAAVVGRWAYELTHNHLASLFGLGMIALDPNILAHARLTTTDLGLTAAAAFSGYTLWRYLTRPSWRRAVIAGIAFGLLNNTKFTAGLFVPLFALVILIAAFQHLLPFGRSKVEARPWQTLGMLAVAFPLAAFVTLWALYGFQIDTLPETLPTLPQLSGLTLPLSHHLEQLLDIGNRAQQGAAAFLWGEYSNTGWWYYFPVTFALKTPFASMMLIGWGVWRMLKGHWRGRIAAGQSAVTTFAALLIPPVGYLAIAMFSTVNLGYRHLLPMLPFLAVFAAWQLPIPPLPNSQSLIPDYQRREYYYALTVLSGWLLITTLYAAPHFIPYFNGFTAGQQNGWQYLADSNVDWGQDLIGLKAWMARENVDQMWLSYFGEARPEYYDINYIGLNSFPPRLMQPNRNPFYPLNPAPGLYAISATNLQGVLFEEHDEFVWFRSQAPKAHIGHSIWIYEVSESEGQPVDVVLAGIQPADLTADLFSQFSTNNLRYRWFSADSSLILPASGGWLATNGELAESLRPLIPAAPQATDGDIILYQLPAQASPFPESLQDFDGATLLDIKIDEQDESSLALITAWEATAETDRPLKIFVHALDAEGNIVGQSDLLEVDSRWWRPQDRFWQLHTLPLSAEPVALRIGLYDAETLDRLGPPLKLALPLP